MVSTLKYKLGLKGPTGSSFQKIERFLKMSKPHKPWPQKPMKPWPQKPMKPWPQKPMKPWPQKPMKPWPQKPVNPWKPMTEAPVLVTEPPPPPTTTTTTTTTPVPTAPSTTPPPPTPPTIDIDLTEDYWPFPSPIEDIDLPEGGAPVVLKPQRSGLAPAPTAAPAPAPALAPLQYFPYSVQFQPFQPLYNYNYTPLVI